MPIVIGLGNDFDLKDPLNLFDGKSFGIEKPAAATPVDRDRDDVVNTIIAEAAGEGDAGMAGVASVIKNRSGIRGKSPGDVVREPKQFTGYSNPGADVQRDMQDPAMRTRAAQIFDDVMSGKISDPTGGADHYHADSVNPDWAGKMPKTTAIGRHQYYRSGAEPKVAATAYAPDQPGSSEDPFQAVLNPKKAAQPSILHSKLQAGKPATYIDHMAPELQQGLTAMFENAPDFVKDGLDILSGARSPERQAQIISENAAKYGIDREAWEADVDRMGPVRAGQKWRKQFRESGMSKNIGAPGGSKHQHGTASDLGWKGGAFSTAPKEVREWVHANAGSFDLTFPMAHEPWHIETIGARGGHRDTPSTMTAFVDDTTKASQSIRPFNSGERRPNSDGTYSTEISTTWKLPDGKWVNVPSLWMAKNGPVQFDADDEEAILGAMKTYEAESGKPFPRFSSEGEAVKAAKARSAGGGAGSGQSIVIDENFQSADGLGVFGQGDNPFTAIADQQRQRIADEQQATADQFEQNRIRAYNEKHNAGVDQQAATLEAENPGRYVTINEDQLPDWQKKWDQANQSTGLMGDTGKILKSGVIGIGQSLTSIADTVFNRLPGGKAFLEASDDIDRWLMGNTLDKKMENADARARASVTDAQAASDAKNWWDEDKGWFGPAWRDPRSYLRAVGESAPASVITMAPGGILARGAYLRALAGGATQRAAAAAAARTATVSGAILEGGMAAGDSAKNIRDRIGAMPRDQLAQSDAVSSLVDGGMSEADAVKAVTEDAATQAFLISGVATGMFGGLGDRALAKIIAEGVGGGVARRIVEGGVRGAVAEGLLEEAPQGAAQAISENAAMRRVNPDQSLTEGLGEAVASGVAAGGVMGGGLGGAGGAARRAPAVSAQEAVEPEQDGWIRVEPEAPAIEAAPAPAPAPTPAPSGPIGRAVKHADEQIGARAPAEVATEAAPVIAETQAPDAEAAAGGRPELGATVRVDAEGIEPFMATVDGYEGEEAILVDGSSGEIYQVPIGNITQIAKSVQTLQRENPTPQGPVPIDDTLPSFSTDPALEPPAPIAGEVTTEGLPPRKEQKQATERFPSAPEPGSRVIVDDENGGRFAATIRSYENDRTEAIVQDDEGNELQVPIEALKISKLTEKQVEAEDLKRNPPVEREKPEMTGTRRQIGDRFVELPDERHARLYDLARERFISKKTLGASHLNIDRVDGPELRRLAEDFGVTETAVGSMADDYRYRVERAAKEARSKLPVKMHPVNERRLKQWQSERAKAESKADTAPAPAANDSASWWDVDLTDQDRKRVLAEAGVKRNERSMWGSFTPAIRQKLEATRAPAQPGDLPTAFTTSKGSTYTVHEDGTTSRNKAARSDPGHEGDSGAKPRTAKTIYLDGNASELSSAGLNGDMKEWRVALKDGHAVLLGRNPKTGEWGISGGGKGVPFHTEPAVGRYPLELWNRSDDVRGLEGYARMHAGNAITGVSAAATSDMEAAAAADLVSVESQTVDEAAHEAATSPDNDKPEPSQAQKEAGNYAMGHVRLGGLDISIENPAGSERKGQDASGKPWSVTMESHYGYIRGTEGVDGDHVDVFIKSGTDNLSNNDLAFIVDQVNPDGSYDEHKVMLGFNDVEEARAAYLANYSKGWKGLGEISGLPVGEFKSWLKSDAVTQPFASDLRTAIPSANVVTIDNVADKARELRGDPPAPAYEKPTLPATVYHGTSGGGFTSFDTYGGKYGLFGNGGYFTEDPSIATEYTRKGKGETPTVYAAALDARNPLDMDGPADLAAWENAFPEYFDANGFREAFGSEKQKKGFTNEEVYRELEDIVAQEMIPDYEGAEIMQEGIRSMGHDAITHIGGGRHKSSKGTKHRVWIVFDPEQVQDLRPTTEEIGFAEDASWPVPSKSAPKLMEPIEAFHGTMGDFIRFDPSLLGSETGANSAKSAFFFSSDPVVSAGYAKGYNPYKEGILAKLLPGKLGDLYQRFNEAVLRFLRHRSVIVPDGQILRTRLRLQNPLIVDVGGDYMSDRQRVAAIEKAKRGGHDSVIFRNSRDPGFTDDSDVPSDVYAVFDADSIDILSKHPDAKSAKEVRDVVSQGFAEQVGGRTDPKVSGTANDLREIAPPERPEGMRTREWAKQSVVDAGKASGHEYLMAIDSDGTVVSFGTAGKRNNTGLNDTVLSAMSNPGRQLVMYHNHPKSGPLSGPDISMLAMPGVHSVWAFGHDGTEARAALLPNAQVRMPEADGLAATARLQAALDAAGEPVRSVIRKAETSRIINQEVAALAARNIPSLLASRAGIIDLKTEAAYNTAEIEGLDAALDRAALGLAKEFSNGRPADADRARLRRPADRVGSTRGLEGMGSGGEQMARRSAEGGLSEGGTRNDQSEKRLWEEVEADFGTAQPTKANIVSAIRDRLSGKFHDAQPSLLATVPLNYFPDLAGDRIPAIADYLLVKRKMDAYRGGKHDEAATLADRWHKFISKGFVGVDKSRAAQLADLMHDSTLAGIDPSLTTDEEKAKPGYDALRKRFTALPPNGRDLYQEVRDAYRDQATELDDLLLDNVRKAQELAAQHAERQYRETLADIAASNRDPIARRNAEEAAASKYKAERTKGQWAARARMTRLRQQFESNRVSPPYFPLSRFGDYFVTAKRPIRDGDGNVTGSDVLHFSRHETKAEADATLKAISADIQGAEITTGRMPKGGEIRKVMDPRVVGDIEKLLADSGVGEDVRDALYQRWLATFPDLSMRKRFIHRKGISGFNRDAFRAFGSAMFHGAHQMARLKYGMELQENVNRAEEQAKEFPDNTREMALVNELNLRDKWVRNPGGNAFVNYANSAAFVWYMGFSPAAAVVNATQTWMMGVPLLGAKFGVGKATAALLTASREFAQGLGDLKKARLSREEKAAMDAFYDSGLIDRTQSHDLAAVGETGTRYDPVRAKVMRAASWGFHNVEVFNRSVTALAAYRLARDAGQGHLEAINTAHERTYSIHFDMTNSSRPRIMQSPTMKFALMFRSFQINMLYRLFRDVHQSVKGESRQVRKEAVTQLAGTVGMMGLMAGATGTVGYGLAMTAASLLSSVFGDDDDPMPMEQRFKAGVVDMLGPQLGGIFLYGAPGHYLGIDLTARIGMPDLWFRSPDRDLQGKDAWEYYVLNSLGAGVSMIGSMFDAYKVTTDDQSVARGVEIAAPKAVRDLMKTWRYAWDGVTTRRGDEVVAQEDISIGNLISQSLGFTPAKISETYDRSSALKNAEKSINDARRGAINAFAKAIESKDADSRKEAMAEIQKFNKNPAHRSVAITGETLKRSLTNRARNRNKREDGALIQNQALGIQLRRELPERVYD